MKYKIISNRYFSLHYWFLNEGVEGLSVQYIYNGDATVILDTEFLDPDEDGDELFADELESLRKSVSSNSEWKMAFPAPYYFKNFDRSVFWERPTNETDVGNGGLLINPRAIQIKIDWDDRRNSRSRPRTFGTWDKEFIWIGGKFSLAENKQQSDEYKILATVWNSECWRHHDKLVNYMREKRNLELDENEAEFHCPGLIKVIGAF